MDPIAITAGLTVITGLATAATTWLWTVQRPEDRVLVVSTWIAMALASVGWLALWPSAQLPADLITILKEGTGAITVAKAAPADGFTRAFAWHHDAWIRGTADGNWATLRDAIRVNLWATTVGWIAFAAFSRRQVDGVLWVVLVAFYGVNLNTVHGALSTSPGPLLTLCFWGAALPMGWICGPRPPQGPSRGFAWTALFGWAVLAGLTRSEWFIVGAIALVAAGSGPGRLAAWTTVAMDVAKRKGWWLLAGAFLANGLSQVLGPPLGYAMALVNVVDLAQLTWPAVLAWSAPLGFVALFVVGLITAARHGGAQLALVVGLLALFRIYYAACHGVFFEMFRYHTHLIGPAFLIMALGAGAIQRWTTHDGRQLRPWVMLGLAALFVAPPPPGMVSRFWPDNARPRVPMLLSTIHQQEVRDLTRWMDENPTCTFISRVTREGHGDARAEPYDYLVWGTNHPGLHRDSHATDPMTALTDAPAPWSQADCWLYFQGQDCNLVSDVGCEADRAAATETLDETEYPGVLYNDADERTENRDHVVFGVYRLR